MLNLKNNTELKKALSIGSLCFVSYLGVYFLRNILSTISPQMVNEGRITNDQIGSLSSLFFITYAVGQLINGALGDKIKAKYMLSIGLVLAGISNYLFLQFFEERWSLAYVIYGLSGLFLSMIYGPMTKVVSENITPLYATRCTVGYSFASFLASPFAGIAAVLFIWQGVFVFGSAFAIILGVLCFVGLSILEKKGMVAFNKFDKPKQKGGNIGLLIKRQIIKFTFVSVLTGIVRTTVVFWLPTYLSQRLNFSADASAMIFTVVTLLISASAFVSVFVYEKLGHNMDLTLFLSFVVSAVAFLLVFLISQSIPNIIFMIFGIFAANCAASMLWSKYCPSLYDTGMVSGATGFLDFMSYMAAAVSSTLFANAVSDIGWGGLVLVWCGLMVVGVVVSLPFKKIKAK